MDDRDGGLVGRERYSAPTAMPMLMSPDLMELAIWEVAARPEEQKRATLETLEVTGKPAARRAARQWYAALPSVTLGFVRLVFTDLTEGYWIAGKEGWRGKDERGWTLTFPRQISSTRPGSILLRSSTCCKSLKTIKSRGVSLRPLLPLLHSGVRIARVMTTYVVRILCCSVRPRSQPLLAV